MTNRRNFIGSVSLAAASLAVSRLAFASQSMPTSWSPYRNAIAIDGEGGVGFFLSDTEEGAADDIAAARASGLSAALFSVAPSGRFWMNDAAFEHVKAFIARTKARIAEHSDALTLVETANDIPRAHRERKLGIIMRFQGAEPLGEDVERIATFRALGVRVIQLTHNRRNLLGDGCTEPSEAGLSRFGYEVVERLNAEKIVVDLAHGSQKTIADGIRASKAPMLISHTGCRALADLPRNTADSELRAMAEKGGVAGIIFWPYLRTDTQPMAIDVIRHVEHAIDVCGEDHVGLGTDGAVAPTARTPEFEKDNREFIAGLVEDGILAKGRPSDLYPFIPDLNVANRFEVLAAMLAARGHSEARIDKILGGNFARVFRDVWT
jgi:membrane dipeptidase